MPCRYGNLLCILSACLTRANAVSFPPWGQSAHAPRAYAVSHTAQTAEDAVVGTAQGVIVFFGYGRTGSSLVAALLDAHPHIILTNEFDLLDNLHDSNNRSYSKRDLLVELYRVSRKQAEDRSSGGGYSYTIPKLWQGKVVGQPWLLGDKKAETTSGMGLEGLTDALRELANITGLPLKLVYVGRNPYENIGTRAVKEHTGRINALEQDYFTRVEGKEIEPEDMSEYIGGAFMRHYFDLAKTNQAVMDLLAKDPNYFGTRADVINIDYEDLVRNASRTMRRVCRELGVACSEDYIRETSAVVWPTYHYTRFSVTWGERNICRIYRKSLKFPHLRHYMLNTEALPASMAVPCGKECFPGASPCPCSRNFLNACGEGQGASRDLATVSQPPGVTPGAEASPSQPAGPDA